MRARQIRIGLQELSAIAGLAALSLLSGCVAPAYPAKSQASAQALSRSPSSQQGWGSPTAPSGGGSGGVTPPALPPDWSPPRIVTVSPETGMYAAMPASVTVTFSETMERPTIELPSNVELRCAGAIHALQAIHATDASVTFDLPQVSGLKAGDQCSLTLSSGMRDLGGNALEGDISRNRVLTYTLGASGTPSADPAAPPTGAISYPMAGDRLAGWVGFTASPVDALGGTAHIAKVDFYAGGVLLGTATQAPYAIEFDTTNATQFINGFEYTLSINVTNRAGKVTVAADSIQVRIGNPRQLIWSPVYGGTGGSVDHDETQRGSALSGIEARSGSYVDWLQPVWRRTYGARDSYTGKAFGGDGGGYSPLSCQPGYYVAGIYGKADKYVNSLGLICRNLSSTDQYDSGRIGGDKGKDFRWACDPDRFVTKLTVRSGQYIDMIEIGCQ